MSSTWSERLQTEAKLDMEDDFDGRVAVAIWRPSKFQDKIKLDSNGAP